MTGLAPVRAHDGRWRGPGKRFDIEFAFEVSTTEPGGSGGEYRLG